MKLLLRLGFSISFSLILLELLLRFFWMLPVTAKGAYLCRDEVADHSHYPYGIGRMMTDEFNIVLRMNNIGMRDDDVEIVKPSGVRRILVLGDSFMEGWGCERGEIFTDRLEVELAKRWPGEPVEVVAAGVASWSPLCEMSWLKYRGFDLSPDAVILAVDATDLAGDSFYAHRLVRDDKGRPDHIAPGRHRLDLPAPLHKFLSRWSYIYRYAERFVTKKLPVTEWDYGFWAESDDVWAGLREIEKIPEPQYSSYWVHTREALKTANELCAERGTPFLVIQYPTGVETDSSCWAEGRSTADFGPGMIGPRRFERMEEITRADSVPYFGLLSAFQAHTKPATLFYPYDGHWSPAGHAYAAEVVAEEVIRRGMIRAIARQE